MREQAYASSAHAGYGGDEFVLLLPGNSEGMDLYIEKVGMRILKHVDAIRIPQAANLRVSVSIGISMQSSEILDGKALLEMADHALYQAKEAGKACLHIHSDEQFHLACVPGKRVTLQPV